MTTPTARVAAGVPTGGRFAATAHAEPDVAFAAAETQYVIGKIGGTADDYDRTVEETIGGVINQYRAHGGQGEEDLAYRRGWAESQMFTAVALADPAAPDVELALRQVNLRGAVMTLPGIDGGEDAHPNTETNRAAVRAAGAGRVQEPLTEAQTNRLVDMHLRTAVAAQELAFPDGQDGHRAKGTQTWGFIGQRNGALDGIDAILSPRDRTGATHTRGEKLRVAMVEGNLDLTELKSMAYGHDEWDEFIGD